MLAGVVAGVAIGITQGDLALWLSVGVGMGMALVVAVGAMLGDKKK